MGTRGAYGFRLDRTDKVTYNHFDSYPEGLGLDLLRELSACDHSQLAEIARQILLVREDSTPTPEQIAQLSKWADVGVSRQSLDDWYCLLRDAQGKLSPWISREVPVMIDSHEFLGDSLFCEWAYIINLDDGTFEVYRGFNKVPTAAGRYAALRERHSAEYCGVKLLTTIPLDSLRGKSDAELEEIVSAWDRDTDEEAA